MTNEARIPDDFTSQCQDYLDNRMPPKQKADFLAMVEANPEKKRLFLAYFALHGRLNELPAVPPSEAFEARLLEAIATHPSVSSPLVLVKSATSVRSWFKRPAYQAAAAVFVAFLLGAGFNSAVWNGNDPSAVMSPIAESSDEQLMTDMVAFWETAETDIAAADDIFAVSSVDAGFIEPNMPEQPFPEAISIDMMDGTN